jgi:hypothetical protein
VDVIDVSNFVVLPPCPLSGGVFPLTRSPSWMSVLVHVNPTTYAVDLMRLGAFTMTMGISALVLFQREQP